MYGGAVITHGRACSGHGARSSARADECPPTFGAGRVCAAPGCETLLSSYNPRLGLLSAQQRLDSGAPSGQTPPPR